MHIQTAGRRVIAGSLRNRFFPKNDENERAINTIPIITSDITIVDLELNVCISGSELTILYIK
jgi:hypothetical protein